jgi:hypothetical protein
VRSLGRRYIIPWMNYIHIQKKENRVRVWTAVDRNRLCFVSFKIGDGSISTLESLWNKAKGSVVEIVCTDGNPVYKEYFEYDTILQDFSSDKDCSDSEPSSLSEIDSTVKEEGGNKKCGMVFESTNENTEEIQSKNTKKNKKNKRCKKNKRNKKR